MNYTVTEVFHLCVSHLQTQPKTTKKNPKYLFKNVIIVMVFLI